MIPDEDSLHSADYPYRRSTIAGDQALHVLLLATKIATFSLVLVVDGQIVTGTAINRKRWWDLFFEEIRQAGGGPFADGLEMVVEEMGTLIIDDELDGDLPVYAHLIKAHAGENGPMLMRVRIDRISAWSFGNTPDGAAGANELES